MQMEKKQKAMVVPDVALPVNRLARKQMKLHLLEDIRMDMLICDIEGWDKTEYLNELKELINDIGTGERKRV